MGCYRCFICSGYFDSHEHGCCEHPTEKFENICEGCDENNRDEDLNWIGEKND